METKMLEIRDRATCIPAMAVLMESDVTEERKLLRRAGYGANTNLVMLIYPSIDKATYDPYNWGDSRTLGIAHQEITDKWDTLKSGDIIDVEFILGETREKKPSDIQNNH